LFAPDIPYKCQKSLIKLVLEQYWVSRVICIFGTNMGIFLSIKIAKRGTYEVKLIFRISLN
jgi:hypothetical protein